MKSIWQIELREEELAEEVNIRNQYNKIILRTLGFFKILDIAFMSRENRPKYIL